jgi:hypothetical protein
MAERGLGEKPFAFWAATAKARHLGGGPCLVQKDQSVWLKPHFQLAHARPFVARLFDVGPILLAGPQSFFETITGPNQPTRKGSRICLLAPLKPAQRPIPAW